MTSFSYEDLAKRYEELTGVVKCHCVFATDLVGGQPAHEDGIEAYVKHHLKLEGPEAEEAVKRILREEVGETDVPAAEGELQEKKVYGVNALRRTPLGPFLGNWMVKAAVKQAASRLNIFRSNRGSKGDFAEAGQVTAIGPSLLEPEHPERIYLLSPDGTAPATTRWESFMGRVSTPQGFKSITHESEICEAGTLFSWQMRFLPERVQEEDVRDIIALAMIVGLGSARALERGKFRILQATIDLGQKQPPRREKAPAKEVVTGR